LPIAIPLVGGLAIPCDSLSVVVRHTLAQEVHEADGALRAGIPLLGQWTQYLERRREVSLLIGGLAVLKRPRHCRAEQREREKPPGDECPDALVHVRSVASPYKGRRAPLTRRSTERLSSPANFLLLHAKRAAREPRQADDQLVVERRASSPVTRSIAELFGPL
jgi:hypothetical protein